MGIASELLALRRNHFSSIASLHAALERCHQAPPDKLHARIFQLEEAVDLALTNIAAYAAEAAAEILPTPRPARRPSSVRPRFRKSHPLDTTGSHQQRRLFLS